MSTMFSSGFMGGCYYQIQKEMDRVRVMIATPVVVKETKLATDKQARDWIDRQVMQYLRTTDYET